MKIKLSVVILTKNEEKQILTCLQSVAFAEEIIIVDSGSTDKTLELAEKYTSQIIKVDFTNFSDLRNVGLNKAKYEWILYIDADEQLSPELQKEISELITRSKKPLFAAYYLCRENYYLGKKWPVTEKIERLFQKKDLIGWYGNVHESPQIAGSRGVLFNKIIHRTHNSLEEMLVNTVKWSDFEAQARFAAHHKPIKWWRIFRVMISSFYNSYITQKGYSVGIEGLIESIYQAFSMFVTYAKLWELQKIKNPAEQSLAKQSLDSFSNIQPDKRLE